MATSAEEKSSTADSRNDVIDLMNNITLDNKTGNGKVNSDNEGQDISNLDGKGLTTLSPANVEFSLPPGYASAAAFAEDDNYNMNHAQRGHCVIFNHRYFNVNNLGERNGTNVDRDKAKQLFESLGFNVKVYNDLYCKDIRDKLETYALETDHSSCDCFVVVFMSHGEDGHLYGRDNLFKVELLYSYFTADQCPSLAGKPKLFFIQACRGEGLDKGMTMVKAMDEADSVSYSMYTIPTHADFLVCYSTVTGYYSWRNTTNGSWFIQSLVRVFNQYASTMDVLSMMTAVNRYMVLHFESNCPSSPSMHGKKQTACITSTLMRQIFLKPKQ